MQSPNDIPTAVAAIQEEIRALRLQLEDIGSVCADLLAQQSALHEILVEYRALASSNLDAWNTLMASASNAGMAAVLAEMQATFGF